MAKPAYYQSNCLTNDEIKYLSEFYFSSTEKIYINSGKKLYHTGSIIKTPLQNWAPNFIVKTSILRLIHSKIIQRSVERNKCFRLER